MCSKLSLMKESQRANCHPRVDRESPLFGDAPSSVFLILTDQHKGWIAAQARLIAAAWHLRV